MPTGADLLASQLSLGMLTDVFAFTLGFDIPLKQRLLAEWNVDRRAAVLSEKLSALAQRLKCAASSDSTEVPPRFSLN